MVGAVNHKTMCNCYMSDTVLGIGMYKMKRWNHSWVSARSGAHTFSWVDVWMWRKLKVYGTCSLGIVIKHQDVRHLESQLNYRPNPIKKKNNLFFSLIFFNIACVLIPIIISLHIETVVETGICAYPNVHSFFAS